MGNAKGVIILTDERTLFHTQKYIEKYTGVSCYIIPKLTIQIAIEIAKMILVAGDGQEIKAIFNIGRRSGSLEKLINILTGKGIK